MKYLGGTGLVMAAGDVLATTADSDNAVQTANYNKELFKEHLCFKSNGKFKIVQFTDVHYKAEDERNSRPSLDIMNEVLDRESPDLVVYTGDVVYSNKTLNGLDTVLDLAIRRNIPFAVVWGNHDDEFDHSRQELYDYVQQKKGAIMPKRISAESPDYVIPLKAHDSSKDVALLYCIDSHSYSKVKGVSGYDWIYADQISWYRNVSQQFKAVNSGTPLPALAFFHIPLPEFRDALGEDHNRMFGVKGEGICSPRVNSGFFMAAKECGDIMGMFVGHDHDNDYAVTYKDILLAYGRYSGGDTVYNDIPNGARVIELYEGERKFDTHIRIAKNQVESRITYPDSFVLKRYNKVPKTAEELAQEKIEADANAKTQADKLAKEASEAKKKADELAKKAADAKARAEEIIKAASKL